ncbi:tetratricopeptide repeat-containing sulfotransferase family protein [Pseudemcibacter aquimaris]|uniref:tetratricopeptide repeat-containing sulfotransferase family protein n=1 Tax=Pseudemcibacter aquimaris TaxID=2857064 RepID=UPI002012B8EC|nr:sulfotransferase [Pseudemcibacter aquimaris]MCC3861656.1 sulfotransferase [Pseudemcibacter aquimaris]WDU58427.1 sulfotransferase [Pseudemcibacter aquimaris]
MDLNQAIQKAVSFANQGNLAAAEKTCQDIIRANDRFHPAYHLLGQIALGTGRIDMALAMTQRAGSLDQRNVNYVRDMAEILFFAGKPQDAVNFIGRAISINPNDAKSHNIAGLSFNVLGDLSRARIAFETVLKLDPKNSSAHNNLGSVLEKSGDEAGAKSAYKKAVSLDKGNVEALNNLASMLIAAGDLDGAKEKLKAAIKTRPDYIEAHHNLSGLKKYKSGDKDIKILEELDPSKMPPINQARREFILGKVYADLGDHDVAFDHYILGNKKMREMIQYDGQAAEKFHDELKSVFNAEFCSTKKGANDDPTPIFIVGMPRSGSTLTEQILSSHSDVFAAGELTTLGNLIKEKCSDFPNGIGILSDDELNSIGEAYLADIKTRAPHAKRIIDKMPGNYRFLGVISKILPNAKIIHTTRNPMDCCVSIYTRLFLEPIHYAYDLKELGDYYKMYQDMMDHWRDVLPQGMMTEVGYEDVVDDLENQAKELVQFADLDWQDDVLDFHKQKGNVTTASAAQVRKPIYKSSVERWRVYEDRLGDLMNILNGDKETI